jgi:hypothetical protein
MRSQSEPQPPWRPIGSALARLAMEPAARLIQIKGTRSLCHGSLFQTGHHRDA